MEKRHLVPRDLAGKSRALAVQVHTAYGFLETEKEFWGGACCSPHWRAPGACREPRGVRGADRVPRVSGGLGQETVGLVCSAEPTERAGEAEVGLVTEFADWGAYVFSEGF